MKKSRSYRWMEVIIQALIVASLVAFSIETIPGLSEQSIQYLFWFEAFSVTVFTCEYFVRAYHSRPTRSYVFSFFGVIDLLAVLPFYLQLGVDLRSLRAFQLLRLFRLLKLARYSAAVQRFHRALLIAREELVLFACVSFILLFLSAVGIYHFENEAQPETFASVFHSLWWAVATLTTVGYGDVYPITVGGKIFTFLVLVVGLGVVAIPAGLVASALTAARDDEQV